jgi:hypothetical protein
MRRLGQIAIILGSFLVCVGIVSAYETYHAPPPADDDTGYCMTCHPPFEDDLHDLHRNNFTGNCNLCHTGSGRNNPFMMWSVDGSGPLGCAGCHGRDYGETIELPNGYDNGSSTFDLNGLPKASGYGLRKQHLNAGVNDCLACHADVDQSFILGEDVNPPQYSRADVVILNSCNTDGSEDGSPEPNGDDNVGLDNDGDTVIDGLDPDCGAPVPGPGETGTLRVDAKDEVLGTMDLLYVVACDTSQNTIEWGFLNQVSSYTYAGQECLIGNTGSYVWTYPAGDIFFLIVANNGTIEGSYGLDGNGTERPEDSSSTVCPLPQDLADRCD